jgi:hypothetical protein
MAYRYRLCPYLGAELAVWIYLARRFQGEEVAGLEAVEGYLDWYEGVSPAQADTLPFREREYWPVPLARFLAGEIDERRLRETPPLDLNEPGLVPIEVRRIREGIMEYHFVMAELLISGGRPDEAQAHLKRACGLPPRNPMSWVVARQLIRHA